MDIFNNFFNIFRGKKSKRNNSESNSDLNNINMQEIPLSPSEDSRLSKNQEDKENDL